MEYIIGGLALGVLHGLYFMGYLAVGILVTGLMLRLEEWEPHVANIALVLLWPLVLAVWGVVRWCIWVSRSVAYMVSWIAGHKGRYNTDIDDDDGGCCY